MRDIFGANIIIFEFCICVICIYVPLHIYLHMCFMYFSLSIWFSSYVNLFLFSFLLLVAILNSPYRLRNMGFPRMHAMLKQSLKPWFEYGFSANSTPLSQFHLSIWRSSNVLPHFSGLFFCSGPFVRCFWYSFWLLRPDLLF